MHLLSLRACWLFIVCFLLFLKFNSCYYDDKDVGDDLYQIILLSSERDNQSSGLGDSLLAVDYGLEELSQQIVERLLARIQDGEYGADNDPHDDDKNVKRSS